MMRAFTIASTRTLVAGLVVFLAGISPAMAADLKLPPETDQMLPSPLAGYAIAAQKCGICHSSDYVDYQPPKMTKAQWTSEMTKMQRVYGAPISDDEVRLLGIYLAVTYGDASTVTDEDKASKPAVIAGTAPDANPGGVKAGDVQALLSANGCLACHAVDRKVVGPAYRDVAARYKTDAQGVAHVATTIQQGGTGKWGAVPMPSFPGIGAEDAKTLATYVLAQ